MIKRCFAALIAFCMLFSCALAQEAMLASYVLPDEARVYYLPMNERPVVPEGLETMYGLMQPSVYSGDLYLLQMKNGLALLSVSGMLAQREVSPEDLLQLWPRAAADIQLMDGVRSVNADPECAAVQKVGGEELLYVCTQIVCEEGSGVNTLIAEGYAFCDGTGVTELWAVYPDPKDAAHAGMADALRSDLEDLDALIATLTFPSGDTQVLQASLYADEKGLYEMAIPLGSTVLTAQSTPEERQLARTNFVEKNPEGAGRVFDRFMRQLDQVDSSLIFTPDMQGVIKVTATPEKCLAGVEPAGLATLAPTFQGTLALDYDLAACMEDDERVTISQLEHAMMGYWLRMGEMDLQLDLMLCVHPDNWMYEVDVFTAEGDQKTRSELHAFVTQSLRYTPPVNALD